MLFCIVSFSFYGCSNEEKKAPEVKKENLESVTGTSEQQIGDKKVLESNYAPSEKKVW